MKIKFVAYWNTDYNIYRFVDDIWNIDGLYDSILTYKDDYTHLVILNKVNNSLYNIVKENTYGIAIEPYWSTSFDKNMLSYCKKLITYEPDKYNSENTIFSPLIGTHRLYDSVNHEIEPKENRTKEILSENFPKSKKLSIIVNNHGFDSRLDTLYNNRQNLVYKLFDSNLNFDMYGQNWNISDSRYKGFIKNKIDGIKDYEYTISLENSNISGHITEKFIDAILCNTIPIYNGHKDIDRFYPNSCEHLEYDGQEIDRITDILNSGKSYKDYDFRGVKELYFNEYNPIRIILDDITKIII